LFWLSCPLYACLDSEAFSFVGLYPCDRDAPDIGNFKGFILTFPFQSIFSIKRSVYMIVLMHMILWTECVFQVTPVLKYKANKKYDKEISKHKG
jgi:hypothetical protein